MAERWSLSSEDQARVKNLRGRELDPSVMSSVGPLTLYGANIDGPGDVTMAHIGAFLGYDVAEGRVAARHEWHSVPQDGVEVPIYGLCGTAAYIEGPSGAISVEPTDEVNHHTYVWSVSAAIGTAYEDLSLADCPRENSKARALFLGVQEQGHTFRDPLIVQELGKLGLLYSPGVA